MSTATTEMTSITDAILHDHRELQNYYNEVVNSTDPDHQERYGNQFVWELARHSIAEELIVYPAFEKYITNGGHEMAEKDRAEHHQVIATPLTNPCSFANRNRSKSSSRNSRT